MHSVTGSVKVIRTINSPFWKEGAVGEPVCGWVVGGPRRRFRRKGRGPLVYLDSDPEVRSGCVFPGVAAVHI